MKIDGINQEQYTQGPHKDYENNLYNAQKFIQNVANQILKGMTVKIADTQGIKKGVVEISYTPPMEAKIGNFCAPINMHQNKEALTSQLTCMFNHYMALAKQENEKSRPKQMEFLRNEDQPN